MKKIKFALLALSAVGFMSCSTLYYQVAQTKPLDQSVKNNNDDSGYFYEDQNCRIEYNFWAEKGNGGFTIVNKTDQIIYILKEKSFFVKNGVSSPYFGGHVWVDIATTNTMKSVQTSTHTQTIEQTIEAVAPHASVTLSSFIIDKHVIVDCDLDRKPKKNEVATIAFSKENTPVTFGNFITYRVGENGQEKTVQNMFYTSRVTNYRKDALVFVDNRESCINVSGAKKIAVPVIRFAPPTGYFNKYTK